MVIFISKSQDAVQITNHSILHLIAHDQKTVTLMLSSEAGFFTKRNIKLAGIVMEVSFVVLNVKCLTLDKR